MLSHQAGIEDETVQVVEQRFTVTVEGTVIETAGSPMVYASALTICEAIELSEQVLVNVTTTVCVSVQSACPVAVKVRLLESTKLTAPFVIE